MNTDNMHPDHLAETIRAAIRDSGTNANALSLHAHVDRAVIGRFLKSERTVTVETAGRLLAALGCKVTIERPASAGLSAVRRSRRQRAAKKGR